VLLGQQRAEGAGIPLDIDGGTALILHTCDGGYAPACVVLGNMMSAGTVIPKNENAANVMYQKGCNAGGGEGFEVRAVAGGEDGESRWAWEEHAAI